MIHKMYTVHDAKVEAYNTPFCSKTNGEAIRSFSDAVNDPQTMFNKHPEDYTLFALGEYDDGNATFLPLSTPQPLGKALDFKKQLEG